MDADEQAVPEGEPSHEDSQVEPTDSGVSSSVASDDSVLKHSSQDMNGATHTANLHNTCALSGSLREGMEKTELLLTANPSLGLSAASLEVMTSGEQLNLLAEGLESPDGSVSGVQEEEEEKKNNTDSPDCEERGGAQCEWRGGTRGEGDSLKKYCLLLMLCTLLCVQQLKRSLGSGATASELYFNMILFVFRQ